MVEHNTSNKILSLRYDVMKMYVSIGRKTDKWGLESILNEVVLAHRKFYVGFDQKNIERAHGKSQNIR